jgi:hypothetical protein
MMVGDAVMGFGRTSCILDVMSVRPAVAYSLRRLSAAYTGKAINVRRSSDNTALDIGFVNNRLDTATLLAFVGSGSGYVATWYNQGTLGSAGNVSQATAASQPQIVTSGVLQTSNGIPAVLFSGSQYLVTSASVQVVNASTGAVSAFAVASSSSSAQQDLIVQDGSTRVWGLRNGGAIASKPAFYVVNTGVTLVGAGSSLYPTSLFGGTFDGTTVTALSNGVAGGTGSFSGTAQTSTCPVSIGEGLGGQYVSGTISEAMAWGSALSSQDISTLSGNQQTYYLSTPLDALSAALPTVAYGLRQLTKSYPGACINVRRSSDNTALDIGFASGQLDIATLLNFVGSGNGFVTKIYNQGTLRSSGDALQSTAAAQPQIVVSGVLQTFNSRPALLFSGAQSLQTAGSVQAVGASALYSVNAVANASSTATQHAMVTQDDANRVFSLCYANGAHLAAYLFAYSTAGTGEGNNSSEAVPPNENVLTATVSSTTIALFSNGRSAASATISGTLGSGTAPVLLGADIVHGPIYLTGQLSEAMVFPVTLSTADRQTLEHNQEYYFSVTGL